MYLQSCLICSHWGTTAHHRFCDMLTLIQRCVFFDGKAPVRQDDQPGSYCFALDREQPRSLVLRLVVHSRDKQERMDGRNTVLKYSIQRKDRMFSTVVHGAKIVEAPTLTLLVQIMRSDVVPQMVSLWRATSTNNDNHLIQPSTRGNPL